MVAASDSAEHKPGRLIIQEARAQRRPTIAPGSRISTKDQIYYFVDIQIKPAVENDQLSEVFVPGK